MFIWPSKEKYSDTCTFNRAEAWQRSTVKSCFNEVSFERVSCTRLRILLNTICRKPGFNSLRTPLNHGAEQASNETLKQTQQRNWSNASQGGQTALKGHVAVLHYETASTTQQPRGEHRGTIKDCKIAGATTWQRQSNHTFTTESMPEWVYQPRCAICAHAHR